MRRYVYDYPRPSVTADCFVLARGLAGLEVLLIRRDRDPFAGCWALPGGFLDPEEDLAGAARRELAEETGVRTRQTPLELGSASKVGRDPRGQVVSVAFAMFFRRRPRAQAGDDARALAWWPLARLPRLAFDHRDLVALARRRLAERARLYPFGRELLPARFTPADLAAVLGEVLATPLAPAALVRALAAIELLEPVARDGRTSFNAATYRRTARDGLPPATWAFLERARRRRRGTLKPR